MMLCQQKNWIRKSEKNFYFSMKCYKVVMNYLTNIYNFLEVNQDVRFYFGEQWPNAFKVYNIVFNFKIFEDLLTWILISRIDKCEVLSLKSHFLKSYVSIY